MLKFPRVLPLFSVIGVALVSAAAYAQSNFGSVNLGSNATQTVTVTIPSAATFTKISVVTQGATGLDFTASGTGTCATGVAYTAGQTCTIGVTFKPSNAGLRMGAVTLSNGSAGVYDTTYLQGTGAGPQIVFGSGIVTAADPTLNGAALEVPYGIAVDGADTEYIVNKQYSQVGDSVWKVLAGSSTASTISGNGPNGVLVSNIFAEALDGAGDRIIVGSDRDNHALAVRIPPGASKGTAYTDSTSAFFSVAVDGAGDLFLLDNTSPYITVVEYPSTPSNASPITYTPQANGAYLGFPPSGLAVDPAGDIFIADTANNRVVEIPVGGGTAIAIAPTVDGTAIYQPSCVATDSTGNLYICDTANSRIVEVPAGGGTATSIQQVVNGTAINPQALTFDSAGNLYIADFHDYTQNSNAFARIVTIKHSLTAAFSFAETQVGMTSSDSPQSVQIQNTGTSALSLADLTFPIDFPADSSGTDACTNSTTLGTAQRCNLTVDFHPLSTGNKAEHVVISNATSTQPAITVDVSGTGTNVALSARSLDYGSVQEGTKSASQQVTLTNEGSSTLGLVGITVEGADASSFVFGSTCPESLPAGQSCVIHGHFAPTTTGPMSATVTIVDRQQKDSPQTIALTGVGSTPPAVTLTATSLAFGSEQTGTSSASQSLTLTNTGGSPLHLAGISMAGPDASSFASSNNCLPILYPTNTCFISAHLAPKVTGPLSASIVITDNASGSPQTISLTGTGTSTAVTTVSLSPSAINFGNGVVGRAVNSQSVTLTNTGKGTLLIQSLQIVGPDSESFGFNTFFPPSLAPGASYTFDGHLQPTRLGSLTASLVFSTNLPNPQPSVTLTGMGVPPAMASFSATEINFGSEAVGHTSAPQQITLTNTGGVVLNIFSFAVGGANASSFGFGNNCGSQIQINASCTIHGHFAPTTTGPLTATITITDDAGPRSDNYQQTITVTGTGQ